MMSYVSLVGRGGRDDSRLRARVLPAGLGPPVHLASIGGRLSVSGCPASSKMRARRRVDRSSPAPGNAEPAVALADMFNYSHVRGVMWDGPWLRPWRWRLVGRWWDPRLLLLACYFPFGVTLLLIRLPLLLLFGA